MKVHLLSPGPKSKSPPTSLLYLKYYLNDHDIDCEITDEDRIIASRQDVIGITSYTRSRFQAYDLVRKMRIRYPNITIVLGGHHFGALADQALDFLPVTAVIKGEGEQALLEFVQGIRFSGKLAHIEELRCFDPKEPYEHLSKSTKVADGREWFTVDIGRGCPNRCVFCSMGTQKMRIRPLQNILDEIDAKVKLTGCKNCYLSAPTFRFPQSQMQEFCLQLRKRNLNIKTYLRADTSQEDLEWLLIAGLVSAEIGLESGSPRILQRIGKNIDLSRYFEMIKFLKSNDVEVYVFVMLSLPGEMEHDLNMTISAVQKSMPYIRGLGIQVTRIYPDSLLGQQAKFDWFADYRIPEEWTRFSRRVEDWTVPLYFNRLTVAQITEYYERLKRMSYRLYSWRDWKNVVEYKLKSIPFIR